MPGTRTLIVFPEESGGNPDIAFHCVNYATIKAKGGVFGTHDAARLSTVLHPSTGRTGIGQACMQRFETMVWRARSALSGPAHYLDVTTPTNGLERERVPTAEFIVNAIGC